MSTNTHGFVYVTSGFHSVTNGYMLSTIHRALEEGFLARNADAIFNASHADVVAAFIQAHRAGGQREMELEIESVLCCRKMVEIWGDISTVEGLKAEVRGRGRTRCMACWCGWVA
jgi:hypothetical protein